MHPIGMAGLLSFGLSVTLALAEPAPRRIVLIQADDLGYDDLGASGNPLVRTPHLDRLARESVQFLDFTVNPVCAPSRATLLTGRNFLRTGVAHVHGGKDFLHPGERTLANVFTAAGWQTALFGKWHLGTGPGYEPWERGFATAARLQLYRHDRAVFTERGGQRVLERWADAALVDATIEFLDTRREQSSFVYLASMTPHAPLRAPDEHASPYREAGLSQSLSQLYGMVSHLDEQVGRLLDWLEANDMARDTVVIFTSDNGPAVNRTELSDEDRRLRKTSAVRGWKGDLWQGGVRAPLFVRWPGVLRPGVVAAPVDQADLFPTLLAWCGLAAGAGAYPIDGCTMGDVIRSAGKSAGDDRVIFNYAHPGWLTSARAYSPRGLPGEYNPVAPDDRPRLDPAAQSISARRGRFKLLRNPIAPDDNGVQQRHAILVDLFEDPGESVDVSARYPEMRLELDRSLDTWFAGVLASPHAFTAPVHRVEHGGVTIAARMPCRITGDLQNTVQALEGWGAAGTAVSYALDVSDPGAVFVELSWSASPAPGMVIEASVTGSDEVAMLDAAGSWKSAGSLRLARGAGELRLAVVAGSPGAAAGTLSSVRLAPATGSPR